MMQPPLNRHVPITHAVTDFHAEVGVVAVNVLDSFEVIFLFGVRIRTTNEEKKKIPIYCIYDININPNSDSAF